MTIDGCANSSDQNGRGAAHAPVPYLAITGIGSQYPPYAFPPQKFVDFAKRFHDTDKPVLSKLLRLSLSSGIETRASTMDFESGWGCTQEPPTIDQLDSRFRAVGVDLAAQACRKALRDWGGDASDVTHVVCVTFGSLTVPGFDYLVSRRLGLSQQRVVNVFLAGVGCAGSGSVLRVAANTALAETARGRPARVLCFAAEICTMYLRHQFATAEVSTDQENMDIAAAIFSDGASAFVLCNELGLLQGDAATSQEAKFQVMEYERLTVPDTIGHLGAAVKTTGFTSIISQRVPDIAGMGIRPLWKRLLPSYRDKVQDEGLHVRDFDWVVHPGGMAILNNVREGMGLDEEHIRASLDIYRTRGNSGSPTLICVLDRLRGVEMGEGRDHVVLATFGPGMGVEMAFLKRCRYD